MPGLYNVNISEYSTVHVNSDESSAGNVSSGESFTRHVNSGESSTGHVNSDESSTGNVTRCSVPVELFLFRERLQQQNVDMRKRDKV